MHGYHLSTIDAAVPYFHAPLPPIKEPNSPAPRPNPGAGEQMSESGRLETASVTVAARRACGRGGRTIFKSAFRQSGWATAEVEHCSYCAATSIPGLGVA